MRDPNQLELNFDSKSVEPTMRERDAQVWQLLERQRVLVHLNAVARGHKTWSDAARPGTEELVAYGQWILNNPEDLGNQYADILKQEIDARIQEMFQSIPTFPQRYPTPDAYQDCY